MNRPATRRAAFHFLSVVAVASLSCAIYSNTLSSPFIFDDYENIVQNRAIRMTQLELGQLSEAAFQSPFSNRPVAYASFALSYYVGGYETPAYHTINLLIHVVNGVVVYAVALLLLGQSSRSPQGPRVAASTALQTAALVTALLFSAHPLQTQSVTYIVQRMNSLATMFYLLAFLGFILARQARSRRARVSLFTGCLLAWVFALGSKEIAVTLPAAVLMYEWFFSRDLDLLWLRRRGAVYACATVLLAGLLAAAYLGGNPFGGLLKGYAVRDFTLGERLLTQLRVVVFYISLVLAPFPGRLSFSHSFLASTSLVQPITTLLSLLVLVASIGSASWLARRHRIVSFGILWFFLHLTVESSVIALEMAFEHRVYLPLFGPALAVGALLLDASGKLRIRAAVSMLAVALVFGGAAYQRNDVWRSSVALWSDAAAKSPTDQRAHSNLGVALQAEGDLAAALDQFAEAVRLDPSYADGRGNLGAVLSDLGRFEEAAAQLEAALRLSPGHVDAHTNLANLRTKQGRQAEAAHHLSAALELDPDLTIPANNLAWILSTSPDPKLRDPARAIGLMERVIREPGGDHPGFLDTLAAAYAAAGRFELAVSAAARARSLAVERGFGDLASGMGERLALYREGRRYIEHSPSPIDESGSER